MYKRQISVDTETSSLDPQVAELIGISLSYAENISFYIPVGHKNIKGLKNIVFDNQIKCNTPKIEIT